MYSFSYYVCLLIKENTGYGGRNGVFPLIYETVKGLLK